MEAMILYEIELEPKFQEPMPDGVPQVKELIFLMLQHAYFNKKKNSLAPYIALLKKQQMNPSLPVPLKPELVSVLKNPHHINLLSIYRQQIPDPTNQGLFRNVLIYILIIPNTDRYVICTCSPYNTRTVPTRTTTVPFSYIIRTIPALTVPVLYFNQLNFYAS